MQIPATADRNSLAFRAYQERLRNRRYAALAIRRNLNAGKVHVYRTAIAVPYNPSLPMGNFFETNRVWQPPIYSRRSWRITIDY
jgi:hypothetical protein